MTNEMRLIDADALKEALHNFFDGKVIEEPTYILRDVFCYIDNAPTADMDERDADAFESGYIEGLNADKPKGEWLNQFIGGNECVMCSECKLHFDIGTNFCPNCGAYMRPKDV